MPDRPLSDRMRDHLWPLVEGAYRCLNVGLRSPALVLVYSGIDIAGWLHSRDPNEGTRSAFIAWADRYLQPEERFGCSAIDLYGARCGLLHRSSPDSHLAESGECRRILYTWGDADPADLQRAAADRKPNEYVSIHVRWLVEGFRDALRSFSRDADRFPPERRNAVDAKLRRTFTDMPKEPVERYVDLLDQRGDD